MTGLSLADRWARIESGLRSQSVLLGQAAWVSGGFAASLTLRLINNIALAWLLTPALLGTMMLINALRTGGELLSDVGISQSIVKNRRGEERDFLNTAWTLQIIRGVLLFAVACLAAGAIASLYDDPRFQVLLPAAAVIFVISGIMSPARHVLQKRLEVRRIVAFDFATSLASLVIHITLALIWPTIWALIGGLLLSGLVVMGCSFFMIRDLSHELRLERLAVREILNFGKWIFVSSLIFFFAMNFDRLYLAEAVPFALLGVYGVAKTFSEIIANLFVKMASMLIFPRVSSSELRGADLKHRLAPMRWVVVLGTATGLACIASIADLFIVIAYDDRYLAAGTFMTILLAVTWFAILAAISDAIGMGIGKPGMVATSNAAKLSVIVIGLPLLLPQVGFVIALFVLVAGEAVRYTVLALRQRFEGIGFIRQDIAATVLFVVLAFALREATGLIGLTSGVEGWIEAVRASDV